MGVLFFSDLMQDFPVYKRALALFQLQGLIQRFDLDHPLDHKGQLQIIMPVHFMETQPLRHAMMIVDIQHKKGERAVNMRIFFKEFK